MNLIYKKATICDLDTLVKTRIEVLRAVTLHSKKTNMNFQNAPQIGQGLSSVITMQT